MPRMVGAGSSTSTILGILVAVLLVFVVLEFVGVVNIITNLGPR